MRSSIDVKKNIFIREVTTNSKFEEPKEKLCKVCIMVAFHLHASWKLSRSQRRQRGKINYVRDFYVHILKDAKWYVKHCLNHDYSFTKMMFISKNTWRWKSIKEVLNKCPRNGRKLSRVPQRMKILFFLLIQQKVWGHTFFVKGKNDEIWRGVTIQKIDVA